MRLESGLWSIHLRFTVCFCLMMQTHKTKSFYLSHSQITASVVQNIQYLSSIPVYSQHFVLFLVVYIGYNVYCGSYISHNILFVVISDVDFYCIYGCLAKPKWYILMKLFLLLSCLVNPSLSSLLFLLKTLSHCSRSSFVIAHTFIYFIIHS